MSRYPSRISSLYDRGIHEWARACGLKESTRVPCVHSLVNPFCRHSLALMDDCRDSGAVDHPSLWNKGGRPELLLAHIYAPTEDAERKAWRRDVERYAREHGCFVWIGRPNHPASFYNRGRCSPLIYTRYGVDPYEFSLVARELFRS